MIFSYKSNVPQNIVLKDNLHTVAILNTHYLMLVGVGARLRELNLW
jgi:hypothetical protein